MWAASIGSLPGPCHSLIPKLTRLPRRLIGPLVLSVTVNSRPPDQNIQGLGRTSRTAIDSSMKPTNPIEKQDEGEEKEGREISGSDVLWAMQKADAHKKRVSGMKKTKKKNKMKKSKGSSFSHVEQEVAMDYGNVRPLSINSEWGCRLHELEKRLQELFSERI